MKEKKGKDTLANKQKVKKVASSNNISQQPNIQNEEKATPSEKDIKNVSQEKTESPKTDMPKSDIQVPQKKGKPWSKALTIVVATVLIVISVGCFGATAWLVATQFKVVEVTGSSYICVLEDGVEKEVEKISSDTVKFAFNDEGKDISVANVGDKALLAGQYLKIVYDLKNIGTSDISLEFEIVTNKRNNFDITFSEGENDYHLNGDLYIVNLKKDESKQIVFYFNIKSSSSEGACDISIKNSFYKK